MLARINMAPSFAILSVVVAVLACATNAAADGDNLPQARLVEYRQGSSLRFHWTVPLAGSCASAGVGFVGSPNFQSGFQVQIFNSSGSTSHPIIDTGKLLSTTSTGVSIPQVDAEIYRELSSARTFMWRVRTWVGADQQCPSPSSWSELGSFTVTPGFSDNAKPIWGPGSAKYVFLRRDVNITDSKHVSKVTVAVTAAQSNGMEKLLGAYRLYVNGKVCGIGPGRGDTAVGELNHTMFDVIDVTEHVGASISFPLAIQSYAGAAPGKVIAECTIEYTDGTSTVVVSDDMWKGFDATKYFNPEGNTGGAYAAPQENIVADEYPGDWTSAGFNDVSWVKATEQTSFGYVIKQKETLPLNITVDNVPPVIIKLSDTAYFFDYETETMAGITLTVPSASSVNAKYVQLTLSEELDGPYGTGALLYPMRTGNHYRYLWTLSETQSFFELHEYALFRYGTLVFCNNADDGCVMPPPPPPPPAPPAMCGTAEENAKLYLGCGKGKVSKIVFANYGEPTGTCLSNNSASNNFSVNSKCSASNSVSVISTLCLGKEGCIITAQNSLFKGCDKCLPDGDPCHLSTKHLSVAIECSSATEALPALGDKHTTSSRSVEELPFALSAWVVRYPWKEDDSSFSSSNDMLNQVYNLCRNTLKVTSLDTTTDSNTRERLPYEADGFITGNSRYGLQQDTLWQLHSSRHNIRNPTWPTEWRQFMPLMAHEHWMQSGDTALANEFWDTLVNSTQVNCVNKTTQLVDFSNCARVGQRDLVDWPEDARDGYVMTDVNTIISAFMVGGLRALADLATATGRDPTPFSRQANATEAAMKVALFNSTTGLMVDGLYGAEHHSAWHAQTNALWFDVFPDAAKANAVQYLRKRRIVGSVYAVYSYFQAVYKADCDHGDVALEMLTQCDTNSWCHMLQVNATATMEAWSRSEKPNLSWSHPWATAAMTAIIRGFMGLQATSPSFSTWSLKPQPGNATFANIKVPSNSGSFEIGVNSTASLFTIKLTAPTNTKGSVCLPMMGSVSMSLNVDGAVVKGYAKGDYVCVDNVTGGGTHLITRSTTATTPTTTN